MWNVMRPRARAWLMMQNSRHLVLPVMLGAAVCLPLAVVILWLVMRVVAAFGSSLPQPPDVADAPPVMNSPELTFDERNADRLRTRLSARLGRDVAQVSSAQELSILFAEVDRHDGRVPRDWTDYHERLSQMIERSGVTHNEAGLAVLSVQEDANSDAKRHDVSLHQVIGELDGFIVTLGRDVSGDGTVLLAAAAFSSGVEPSLITQRSTGPIDVIEIDRRTVSRAPHIESWRIVTYSRLAAPVKARIEIQWLDVDGFELHKSIEFGVQIPPGQATFTGTQMMTDAIRDQLHTATATVYYDQ